MVRRMADQMYSKGVYDLNDLGTGPDGSFINKRTNETIDPNHFIEVGDESGTHYFSFTPEGLAHDFTPYSHGSPIGQAIRTLGSIIPSPVQPIFAAYNALDAANKGNYGQAALALLPGAIEGLAGGSDLLSNLAGAGGEDLNLLAKTPAGQIVEAGTGVAGNTADIIGKGVQGGVSAALGGQNVLSGAVTGALGPASASNVEIGNTNISVGDAVKAARIATILSSNNPDYGAAASLAGQLANSQNLVLAGRAGSFLSAIDAKDPARIFSTGFALKDSATTSYDNYRRANPNSLRGDEAPEPSMSSPIQTASVDSLVGGGGEDTNQILDASAQVGQVAGEGSQVAATDVGARNDATAVDYRTLPKRPSEMTKDEFDSIYFSSGSSYIPDDQLSLEDNSALNEEHDRRYPDWNKNNETKLSDNTNGSLKQSIARLIGTVAVDADGNPLPNDSSISGKYATLIGSGVGEEPDLPLDFFANSVLTGKQKEDFFLLFTELIQNATEAEKPLLQRMLNDINSAEVKDTAADSSAGSASSASDATADSSAGSASSASDATAGAASAGNAAADATESAGGSGGNAAAATDASAAGGSFDEATGGGKPEAPRLSEAEQRLANNALVEAAAAELINGGMSVSRAFRRAAAENGLTDGDYDLPDWAETPAQKALKMAIGVYDADLKYDINGDGKITLKDALAILNGAALVQSPSSDTVTLVTTGAAAVSQADSVIGGGASNDSVTLITSGGASVSAIDSGTGSGDSVTLITSDSGGVSATESVGSGFGSDTVTLITGGGLSVSAIDSGTGGGGSDTVTLTTGGGGDVSSIASVVGSSSSDTVALFSAVNSVVGSTGSDTVTLITTGAVSVSAIDTALVTVAPDRVTLLGSGSTAADGSGSAKPADADLPIRKVGDLGKYVSPLAGYQDLVQKMYNTAMDEKAQQQQPMPYQQQDENSYWDYGQQEKPFESMFGLFGGMAGGNEIKAATGGSIAALMAAGGASKTGRGSSALVPHSGKLRVDFRRGDAVTGPGDGQSDDIPAMLADGEFVFPADVVSALGNGSTKAGSDRLYDMMHAIRARARKAPPKSLPPPAKSPLEYLRGKK
jgi:hypothetical protein